MTAMVQQRYGPPDVHSLAEIPRPDIGPDDALIRVRAVGVSYPDFVMTRGVPYVVRLVAGLRRPKHGVRGSDVAGVVTEVGARVSDLRPGDEVFGWCGRSDDGGGFAEYACCARNKLARKPPALTFMQAAALPTSGVTALQAVRDWAQIQPGQTVLVNGASGGVGTFAVQIAKAFGAEVTGVCSSRNADLVRGIGAGTVIAYTTQDFTRGSVRYDVILDFPHFASRSLADLRRALRPTGTLVPASNTHNRWVGGFSRILPARLIAPFVSCRIRTSEMAQNADDLSALAELVTSGAVSPVIERTYPLNELPEALRTFERGHTRGKIVVTV